MVLLGCSCFRNIVLYEEPVLYAKSSCHGPESPWHDQSLIDNFQTGTEGTQRQNIVIRDSVV